MLWCRTSFRPVSSGQEWLTLCPLHPPVYIVQDMDWRVKCHHCLPRPSTANESLKHIYACLQEEWNSWRSNYTCRIPSRRASRARWGQGSVAVFTIESWTEVITAATARSVTAPQLHPGMCNCARHSRRMIPYILESNPHPFYSFRGLKNQMRIRIACGLDSRSWAGFYKNDRAAVRAVRTIQYNNLLFYLLFIILYTI